MKLSEIVSLNANFKNAINLYLNLNKEDKIESYIPTTSSVAILDMFLEAVFTNNGKANILIGPYGKGKSHLILVLLALLSKENDASTLSSLIDKIAEVDKNVAQKCKRYLKSTNKLLPVIVSNSQDDLRQTFMIALNNALIRAELSDIMPSTFFSEAINVVENWKKNYKDTFESFKSLLKDNGKTIKDFITDMENCDADTLALFKALYPSLTSGSEFNPLAGGDVLVMYKSVAENLKEYGYSGIYIVFDEFSKYIEAQSKNAVGQNMKIVQELCELADDSKDPQIHITLVTHKAIKEYGNFLPETIINAFSGIEGRIQDIEFITSSKNNYELIKNAMQVNDKKLQSVPNKSEFFGKKVIENYYSIPVFNASFNQEDFERIVVRGCYPLNPCAAYLLLNVSEKVAQNERTLFTFISKDETNSLAHYVKNHTEDKKWIVNADLIYDYFKGIFKKEVNEEYVHNEWLNAEYSLKKAETDDERSVLKALAIINIVNKYDDMPANEDIIRLATHLEDSSEILRDLEQKKILYKNSATNFYKFKTRAGSTLKKEIQKRRELKNGSINVPESMAKVSEIRYLMPRKYNYQFSMTRYYDYRFMLVDEFLSLGNLDAVFDKKIHQDGIVFALFSTDGVDYSEQISKYVEKLKSKNVVIVYTRKAFLQEKELLDYEIILDIKNNISFMADNEVLRKELLIMEEDLENSIRKYINEYLCSQTVDFVLYHDGKEWLFKEKFSPEKAVDISCRAIYKKTLKINNELINKRFITTAPIKKARKTIIERVLKKDIDNQFRNGTGPESTIYRAVLVNTGIEAADNNIETKRFLDIFSNYFDSCVENKVGLKKLTDVYFAPPYGMREGVLPIVLAFAISYRNGDVVIYRGDKEAELSVDLVIDMSENPDEYSIFISEEDVKKEEYLSNLIKTFDPDCYASLNGTRITNVFTCMQRWYRSLPQVTKNICVENEITGKNDFVSRLAILRNSLQRADSNAYETVFHSIPTICGTESDYPETNKKLVELKAFLNGYYDELQKYLINKTISLFDSKGRHDLSHTMKEWYDKQSDNAKNGLSDSKMTYFLNAIKELKTFDEHEVIQKIGKVVTGIYVDSWDDSTIEMYFDELQLLKSEIEGIKDDVNSEKQQFSFVDSQGKTQHKYYVNASDPSAEILQNILEDALEDFSGMTLNDRVAVLVKTLEKVINKDV